MSINQIKSKIGIGNNAITKALKRWGIQIRNISESINSRPKKDDYRVWNANTVYMYDKNGDIVNTFLSNGECAKWMVDNGICKTINSARDGIYQSVTKDRFYKSYKFIYEKNELKDVS